MKLLRELLETYAPIEGYAKNRRITRHSDNHGAPEFGLDVTINHDEIYDTLSTGKFDLPCVLRQGPKGPPIHVALSIEVHEAASSSGAFSHEFGVHNPGDNWDFNFDVYSIRAWEPAHAQPLAQLQNQIGPRFLDLIKRALWDDLSDYYQDQENDR